jgi:hypothetical protein
MTTKVRCSCGATVDTAAALPGEPIECPGCGQVVPTVAPPPGVRLLVPALGAGRAAQPQPSDHSAGDWDDPYDAEEQDEADVAPGLVPAAPPPPPDHVARSAVTPSHANVRVEWWHYYRGFPGQAALGIAVAMLGMVGAVVTHPAYAVVAAFGACALFAEFAGVRCRFRTGQPCPAIVISQDPTLVAIGTDLRTPGGSSAMPAVRILWQPLGRLVGGAPAVGTRLAAVGTYVPPARRGAWSDFDARVVRCATRDEVEVMRVTQLLGERDWEDLEALIGRLSARRAGLHTLWDDNRRGRRRTLYKRFAGTLLTLVVIAALVLPLVLVRKPETKLPPGVVPGRVHYDWNR